MKGLNRAGSFAMKVFFVFRLQLCRTELLR
jgi:hypothetical protein